MSAPNTVTPEATDSPAAAESSPDWAQVSYTVDDYQALIASDMWLSNHAPPDLIERYRGMHVAVRGERIIDGDPDFGALGRRLDTNPDARPLNRLLFRYIPPAGTIGRYW